MRPACHEFLSVLLEGYFKGVGIAIKSCCAIDHTIEPVLGHFNCKILKISSALRPARMSSAAVFADPKAIASP